MFNTQTCAVVSGCICGRLFALVSSYLVLQHYRCLSSRGGHLSWCAAAAPAAAPIITSLPWESGWV